jgi:protein arginine kinase activator
MKPCDLCGKNEATVKVRRVDKDAQATDIMVCQECARQHGFADAQTIKADVAEVIADLKNRVNEGDAKLLCPGCAMSWADFKRQGRLGCPKCYEAFHEQLIPLVRRIHGAVQHVGRTATGGRKQAQVKMNVKKLRDALANAIQAEDFEKAAALRDQLKHADAE